ncbi:hypothetical protein H3V53_11875 [Paraburkholderia bengalensis]|uniref:Uncharacterized protein n=1 Tax=Paraburkholderia bengalensis TaxID=2747562 RepID=A0ABU8IQW3_9BURK
MAAALAKPAGSSSEPFRGFTTSGDCASASNACLHPRSLHETRLLHHLLAKAEELILLTPLNGMVDRPPIGAVIRETRLAMGHTLGFAQPAWHARNDTFN